MRALVLCFCAFALSFPAQANIPPGASSAPQFVRVLSPEDEARYREIFALQEKGAWAAADRLIADIGDDVLMGYVEYQRLMHPTA